MLRVMSFNVLASCWVKPEWFPGLDASILNLETRVALNVKAIVARQPDIVCLQEVDANSHPLFETLLQQHGYAITPLSKNEPSSSPIANGTAIAYRCNFVDTLSFLNSRALDVGIGLISLARNWILVNVHLDRQEYGGSQQLPVLLKTLLEHNSNSTYLVVGDTNIKQHDLADVLQTIVPNGNVVHLTPSFSACFAQHQPAITIDHAMLLPGNPENTLRDIAACENNDSEQVLRDTLVELSAKEPSQALTHCITRWGSDHVPICFSVQL